MSWAEQTLKLKDLTLTIDVDGEQVCALRCTTFHSSWSKMCVDCECGNAISIIARQFQSSKLLSSFSPQFLVRFQELHRHARFDFDFAWLNLFALSSSSTCTKPQTIRNESGLSRMSSVSIRVDEISVSNINFTFNKEKIYWEKCLIDRIDHRFLGLKTWLSAWLRFLVFDSHSVECLRVSLVTRPLSAELNLSLKTLSSMRSMVNPSGSSLSLWESN